MARNAVAAPLVMRALLSLTELYFVTGGELTLFGVRGGEMPLFSFIVKEYSTTKAE